MFGASNAVVLMVLIHIFTYQSPLATAFVCQVPSRNEWKTTIRRNDVVQRPRTRRRPPLFGINEWRDLEFENLPTFDDFDDYEVVEIDDSDDEEDDDVYVSYLSVGGKTVTEVGDEDDVPLSSLESDEAMLPREVCVLPFPYEDVLVQGETKQLCLYEDRFIKLFEKAQNEHCGMVAMGLLAENGLIQTVPLCEIEDYNAQMKDSLGIFVTIRVVGRATLVELWQQDPYITAICTELYDETADLSISSSLQAKYPTLQKPREELQNLLGSSIENMMVTLSSLQHKITQQHNSRSDDKDDADMGARLKQARKLDNFLLADVDDDELDGENEIIDDDDFGKDINGKFQKAFQQALQSDTQGYTTKTTESGERSIQHLTAISWAAFAIPQVDVTYKLQALDTMNLFDRLKLAMLVLREIKTDMESRVSPSESKKENVSKTNKATSPRKGQKFDIDEEDDHDSDLWNTLN